jgi:hypothetical protein
MRRSRIAAARSVQTSSPWDVKKHWQISPTWLKRSDILAIDSRQINTLANEISVFLIPAANCGAIGNINMELAGNDSVLPCSRGDPSIVCPETRPKVARVVFLNGLSVGPTRRSMNIGGLGELLAPEAEWIPKKALSACQAMTCGGLQASKGMERSAL